MGWLPIWSPPHAGPAPTVRSPPDWARRPQRAAACSRSGYRARLPAKRPETLDVPSVVVTRWETMTSRLALSGPSILLAIGTGFAAVCGVANADNLPQVRYEVSGSGVADTITYQLDTGQKHIVNVPLPWSTQFTSFGGEGYSGPKHPIKPVFPGRRIVWNRRDQFSERACSY